MAQWATAQDDSFANDLYGSEDFAAAALEYHRLLFTFPNETRTARWVYHLGMCKMRTGDYGKAISFFSQVADSSWLDSARIMEARCYIKLENPAGADSVLSKTHMGEIFLLRGYAHLLMTDHAGAERMLKKVGPQSRIFVPATQLLQINDSLARWKPRSAAVAGALSAFPGLGHVYTHRYSDAASSALMVGTLGLLAGYYYIHGSNTRAALAGGAAFTFYVGSIYGALVSVKLYNHQGPERLRARAARIVDRI